MPARIDCREQAFTIAPRGFAVTGKPGYVALALRRSVRLALEARRRRTGVGPRECLIAIGGPLAVLHDRVRPSSNDVVVGLGENARLDETAHVGDRVVVVHARDERSRRRRAL